VIKQLVFGCMILVLLAACSAPAAEPTVNTNTPVSQPTPQPAASLPQPATSTPVPEAPLAAQVNGKPIYMAVFDNEVARRVQALRDQGFNLDTPEGQAAVADVRSQTLEALIEDELVAQAAAQMGISISDADVEAVIQQDINNAGGQDAFNAWLASNGMTIEEHRAAQRAAMLNNAVRDKITANVPTSTEQVHARYILVLSEDEANQVLGMLQAGGDFAALAQQYSKDSVTSVNGGDLGWFPRGGLLDPALEEAAFALQPGQTSSVVTSQFGGQTVYEIVQVLEREASRPLSVERLMVLQRQTFRQWLDDLKAKAQIERFVTP
jgi:peptidyl-prolyl cis-trans isomerase C